LCAAVEVSVVIAPPPPTIHPLCWWICMFVVLSAGLIWQTTQFVVVCDGSMVGQWVLGGGWWVVGVRSRGVWDICTLNTVA